MSRFAKDAGAKVLSVACQESWERQLNEQAVNGVTQSPRRHSCAIPSRNVMPAVATRCTCLALRLRNAWVGLFRLHESANTEHGTLLSDSQGACRMLLRTSMPPSLLVAKPTCPPNLKQQDSGLQLSVLRGISPPLRQKCRRSFGEANPCA